VHRCLIVTETEESGPLEQLSGKVVVVTGAGNGIGRSLAIEAARQGMSVLVNDIDTGAVDDVVAGISDAGGIAEPDYSSVASWDTAAAIIEHCTERFGRIDGLVNNAAIHPITDAWNETAESFGNAFSVNVLGPTSCAVHAMGVMREQGMGSIVNLGSRGEVGLARLAAYCSSKAALTALSFSWSIDLEPYGVRVNTVWPWADTQMTHYAGRPAIGRPPPPEKNVPLILYLLSDLSATVTGRLFSIRGPDLVSIEKPCSWIPPVIDDEWTIEKVASALKGPLASPGFPFGSYPTDCYFGEFLPKKLGEIEC
jgi:NAD(P)-dependent dehydrogenase (short-subunit alcohol dehydrogenase family)